MSSKRKELKSVVLFGTNGTFGLNLVFSTKASAPGVFPDNHSTISLLIC